MIDSETGEAFTCGIGRETCNWCDDHCRPRRATAAMPVDELRPGDVLPCPSGGDWTVAHVNVENDLCTMRYANGREETDRLRYNLMYYSLNLVALRQEEREQQEIWAAKAREEQERLRNRPCAVGWCEEKVGVEDDYANYCPAHADEESDYETEQVVRLRNELDELQGSILNLAGVALAPYVRALRALDDSRRILGVAQDANGERYEELPSLLEKIVIYDGDVEIEGRGEVLDEDWAPAHARVRESFAGVRQRLRELKRLRRKVARQALAAGLEARIQSAIVYAGVDEGERAW